MSIGPTEAVFILLIVVLLFGKSFGRFGRQAGRMVGRFLRAPHDSSGSGTASNLEGSMRRAGEVAAKVQKLRRVLRSPFSILR